MTDQFDGPSGTIRFGYGSNYTEIEGDGTIALAGDATTWDDLRVALETGKLTGANNPAFEQVSDNGAGSAGVYAYNFDDGDEIWFSVQLPHTWKEGSTIYPHLHWCAEGNASGDNIGIGLEYVWKNINETFGNTTIITRDVAGDTALKHLIHNFAVAGIDGTGQTISSVLLCRFFRQAAGADNYAGGIFATEIDFHFEIDTMGSRAILSK